MVFLVILVCWESNKRLAATMSSLSRELVFLILQFLDEEKLKETVHKYASKSLACLVFLFQFFLL